MPLGTLQLDSLVAEVFLTVSIRIVADIKAITFQFSTKLYPKLQTSNLALKPLLFLYIFVSRRVYYFQMDSNIFGFVELPKCYIESKLQ